MALAVHVLGEIGSDGSRALMVSIDLDHNYPPCGYALVPLIHINPTGMVISPLIQAGAPLFRYNARLKTLQCFTNLTTEKTIGSDLSAFTEIDAIIFGA